VGSRAIKIVQTKDGSNTLFNEAYSQCYHSVKDGAINESLYKHILPALKHHKDKANLRVLDICFGLGYNTFLTILENIKSINPKTIEFFSPELDLDLLKSLKNFTYPKEFDSIRHIIQSISDNLYYEDELHKIEVFCGDAREYIKKLKDIDIVYQDAFSSDVNSELWNLSYFKDIYSILNEQGIITTYSISTNVRLSMSENGLFIYQIESNNTRKSTLAFKRKQTEYKYIDMELKKLRNPDAKPLV
jgi:tRNA U34 5-methylaminomethyl-2-thiouridine-forming methyltransferase MnmC